MNKIATLGDTIGDGYVDDVRGLVRDSVGRYWLGDEHDIKVFDANGHYVGKVGRPGKGPMEFSYPRPIVTAASGNVRVFDSGNYRETVVDPRFQRVSAERLVAGADAINAAALPRPHHYVISMWRPTEDGTGGPLHVIRGDSVLVSFGSDSSSSEAQNPSTSLRVLTSDMDGRIYSAKRFEYQVRIWTANGQRIIGFEGPQLNEHEVRWAPYNLDDHPIPNEIKALQIDQSGSLRVLSWRVRPDWRNYLEPVVFPNGEPGVKLKDSYVIDSVYSSRIDVIDLHRGELVAQLNRPGLLIGLAGQDLVIERVILPEGFTQLSIWKLVLNRPTS